MKKAHDRGAFAASYEARKAKTLSNRPRCKCGCGKPVSKSKALYAKGCFDAMDEENRTKALKKRDWEKLSPQYAKRMSAKVMEWKKTGQYQEIRRTAKLARGMPDHLAAKQWVVRNPYGKLYSFPNLNEWARQHEHLFKDTRPDSKQPFWLRISGGIGAVLAKRGKSCSYKGWVAVSKRELVEEAGYDLLQRDRAAPDA